MTRGQVTCVVKVVDEVEFGEDSSIVAWLFCV